MPDQKALPGYFECHEVENIRRYFEDGGDPNEHFPDGMPIFTLMVEMYLRSPRFKDCIQAFIDHGLKFEPIELLAVFTDDATTLESMIREDPALVHKTYSLFNNTFTSLTGGTLLHYCAEYNCQLCCSTGAPGCRHQCKSGAGREWFRWAYTDFSYGKPGFG